MDKKQLEAASKRLNEAMNNAVGNNEQLYKSYIIAQRMKNFFGDENAKLTKSEYADLRDYFADIEQVSAVQMNMAYLTGVADCMSALDIPADKLGEMLKKINSI